METVFDLPYILLTNQPIVHVQDLMPTLDAVIAASPTCTIWRPSPAAR